MYDMRKVFKSGFLCYIHMYFGYDTRSIQKAHIILYLIIMSYHIIKYHINHFLRNFLINLP